MTPFVDICVVHLWIDNKYFDVILMVIRLQSIGLYEPVLSWGPHCGVHIITSSLQPLVGAPS